MKKNTRTLIVIAVLAVLLAGASMLYTRLSERHMMENLDEFPRITVATDPEDTGEQTEDEPRETMGSDTRYAPDFTVYDLEGNPVKLSDYAGKPIVLNFWASWCGPCKSEMPVFEEKSREYAGQLVFLMINCTDGTRETVDKAHAFIQDNGYTFPVFYDTTQEANTTYNITGLPTTYFIDAQGIAVARGVGGLNEKSLQQGIDLILPQGN